MNEPTAPQTSFDARAASAVAADDALLDLGQVGRVRRRHDGDCRG